MPSDSPEKQPVQPEVIETTETAPKTISIDDYVKANLEDFLSLKQHESDLKNLNKNDSSFNEETFMLWYLAKKLNNYEGPINREDLKNKIFTVDNAKIFGFYYQNPQWKMNDVGGWDESLKEDTAFSKKKSTKTPESEFINKLKTEFEKSGSDNFAETGTANYQSQNIGRLIEISQFHFTAIKDFYNTNPDKKLSDIVEAEKQNQLRQAKKTHSEKVLKAVELSETDLGKIKQNFELFKNSLIPNELMAGIYWLALHKGFNKAYNQTELEQFFNQADGEKNNLYFENGRWYAWKKELYTPPPIGEVSTPQEMVFTKLVAMSETPVEDLATASREFSEKNAVLFLDGRDLFTNLNIQKETAVEEDPTPNLALLDEIGKQIPADSIKWIKLQNAPFLASIEPFKTKPDNFVFLKTAEDKIYAKKEDGQTPEYYSWNNSNQIWDQLNAAPILSVAKDQNKQILETIQSLKTNPDKTIDYINKIPVELTGQITFENSFDNLRTALNNYFKTAYRRYISLENENDVVNKLSQTQTELIMKDIEGKYEAREKKNYSYDLATKKLIGADTKENLAKKTEEEVEKKRLEAEDQEIEKGGEIALWFKKISKSIEKFFKNPLALLGITFFGKEKEADKLETDRNLAKTKLTADFKIPDGYALEIPKKEDIELPDSGILKLPNGLTYHDYNTRLPKTIPGQTLIVSGTIIPKGSSLKKVEMPETIPAEEQKPTDTAVAQTENPDKSSEAA